MVGTDSENPILLCFRYDDYSGTTPTGLERSILGIFRRAGVPLTVGVIPFLKREVDEGRGDFGSPLPAGKTDLLRQATQRGDVEVALHGCNHTRTGKDPHGRDAEMSGLSAEAQGARVEAGRREIGRITGNSPGTFIPPWNRYDRATVRVLESAGFGVLSAGRTGPAPDETSISFLPATCGLHDLEDALDRAREASAGQDGAMGGSDGGIAVVALFHAYDFHEHGGPWARITLEGTEELLSRVVGRPDVRTASVGRAAKLASDAGAERFGMYSAYHESPARRLIPGDWTGGSRRPLTIYPPRRDLRRARRSLRLRAALPILGSATVGMGIGLAGAAAVPADADHLLRGLLWGVPAATLLAGTHAFRNGRLHHRGAWTLAAGVGATIGLWMGFS